MSTLLRENNVGMRKATTWGTAVVFNSTNGLWVREHSPATLNRNIYANGEEFGRGMTTRLHTLEYQEAAGTLTLPIYVGQLEHIFASVFGSVDTAGTPEAGVVQHKIVLKDVLDPSEVPFHTIGWDHGSSVYVVPTAVVAGINVRYDNGLIMDMNYQGVPVSVSGWGSPMGISMPNVGTELFKLSGAAVWINAQGGDALDSGDVVEVSNIEINVERGYESTDIVSGSNQFGIPIDATEPMVTLSMTFPQMPSTDWLSAYNNQTLYKASVVFTGSTIPTKTTAYSIGFYFPSLALQEAPNDAMEPGLPRTLTFRAIKADSAPTGMSYRRPHAYIVNTTATIAASYESPDT